MIYVDRTAVPPPAVLDHEVVQDWMREQAAYQKLDARQRLSSPRPSMDPAPLSGGPTVEDVLFGSVAELFKLCCAICGQASSRVSNHRLRPSKDALGRDGSVSEEHYWWLRFDWENIYQVCAECSSSQGNRFPVGADTRAAAGTTGMDLRAEQPLLLDPCSPHTEDAPEAHFSYTDEGQVVGETERGHVTIEVFGLNRASLLAARPLADLQVRAEWDAFASGAAGAPTLAELIGGHHTFAGLRRQRLRAWLSEAPLALRERVVQTEFEAVMLLFGTGSIPDAKETAKAARAQRAFAKKAADYSVASGADASGYYLRTVAVERVELKNVRAYKEATFSFASGEAERAPWLVLLGENGTGKSTVLQAVALALAGDAYRPSLGLTPNDLLRHRTKKGHVRVHLSGFPEPIVLRFERDADAFTCSHAEPRMLFMGYGATRLLPAGDARSDAAAEQKSASFARAGNLFDPFVPLADAEAWLRDAPEDTFARVVTTLRSVLDLADDQKVERDASGVFVVVGGHRTPLRHQSAGYQAVTALVVDALQVFLSRWPSPEAAEGLVLLDEIGAHLHPRWQMRIVESLRSILPRVQFLATTHSPLCLRGLRRGEVAVLHREASGVHVETDLPPIDGLRVDQLLTSEHFGLRSTLDPEVEARFTWYYALLAKRDRTPEEDATLAHLKQDLDRLRQFGTTRREKLALEWADAQLADEQDLDVPALSGSVRDRIRAAWTRPLAPEADLPEATMTDR